VKGSANVTAAANTEIIAGAVIRRDGRLILARQCSRMPVLATVDR
jgi:hypothetical protein